MRADVYIKRTEWITVEDMEIQPEDVLRIVQHNDNEPLVELTEEAQQRITDLLWRNRHHILVRSHDNVQFAFDARSVEHAWLSGPDEEMADFYAALEAKEQRH